ncbi:MAG: RluA family pseudouridine synthase [Clostridia bacterium]
MELKYIVKEEQTVLNIIKKEFRISARLLLKLKNAKAICLNGENIYVNKTCPLGTLTLDLAKVDLEEKEKIKEYMQLDIDETKIDIVYEDDAFLCINKPADMPVHMSCLHRGNTALELASKYIYKTNFKGKLHIINRLDRQTTGLVIFAKHAYIQECVSLQMQKDLTKKIYIALVDGEAQEEGTIEANIARKEGSIIERCVDKEGAYAKTKYKKIFSDKDKNYSALLVRIYTGRTHQIRVHMQYIGHSILGDDIYNTNEDRKKYIDRVALHAKSIEFIHPISKEKITLEAKLPQDMQKLMQNHQYPLDI